MFELSRANCIVCMLRPATYAGLLGTTPTKLSCRHRGNKSNVPAAKYSSFWGGLCAFLIAAVVTGFILHVSKHVYYKQKFDFVEDVFWYITYPRVIHIMFLGNIMSPFKVKELNGLISILEGRKRFGIQAFFSTQTVLFYRKISIIIITVIIFSQTICFTANILNTSHNVIENLTLILCSAVYAFTAFNFILTGFVYHDLYNICFRRIKKCLSNKITERKSVHIARPKREKIWAHELIRLTRLYSCLQKNFMLGKCYSEGIIVMSLIIFTVMFVFNFFLLTLRLLYEMEMSYLAVVLQIETVTSLFLLATYALVYENLANSSEEIMSFLFRYPISKLNQAEAAQVELMITTLYFQRPIVKASDIFTVGTRLLASISATVTTYVLTALQFHAFWTKD